MSFLREIVMFFEEGWVPVSEVTSEVFRRLQAMRADLPAGPFA